MTDEDRRLGERARSAMGPWSNGMRVVWVSTGDARILTKWAGNCQFRSMDGPVVPDVKNAPTQGVFFARVQEAGKMTELEALGHVMDIMVSRDCGYAEALVLALEETR